MKFKKIILTALTLIIGSASQATLAATYSDVSSLSSYFTAINYLSDLGIIQGYPDQTFHPQSPVNRAEFLKLVLESSDIETDIETPTNFPDVNESAWYAKYIRKAKAEGWITGYEDGYFKPENQINKVEALKIIGEVQNWQTSSNLTEKPFDDTAINAWYTPYIAYAKDKNFLDERTSIFLPEIILLREKVGELLFRSLITRKSESDKYSLSLVTKYPATGFANITSTSTSTATSTATATATTYSTDFFEGIKLTKSFPNIFYENEVYYIEGEAPQTNESSIFIFLAPPNGEAGENITYESNIKNNKFKIPVIFHKNGNFQIGIILGNQGESKIANISILPTLPNMPSEKATSMPSFLNIKYNNQKTSASWNNNGMNFIKMTITQDNAAKTYFFRQGIQNFELNYTDFIDFKELKTYITIQGAVLKTEIPLQFETDLSQPVQKSFVAVKHSHSEILAPYITVNNLQSTLSTLSEITFSGSVKKDVFTEAAVIKPNGLVDLFDLTSTSTLGTYNGLKTIPANGNFSFNYKPKINGTYILEINGTDGSAILNIPIYVNNGIPLIPDFFDLNIYTQPKQNFNLQTARTEMLNLINKERITVGLGAVSMDSNLNTLAQNHSQDMANRDFFGHLNPDGDSPEDRRLAAKIPMPVGENLALAPTVLYSHNGLMQSGIHRNNILNPQWTKIGIGIAIDSLGSLLTTQEFSSNTYSASDLATIENTILDEVNNKRTTLNLTPFQSSAGLNTAATEWSNNMTTQNFFDFTSPNGDSLSDIVNQYEPGKDIQAIIFSAGSQVKIIEEVIKSNDITSNIWKKIGIGVKNDPIGTLLTTILFSTY